MAAKRKTKQPSRASKTHNAPGGRSSFNDSISQAQSSSRDVLPAPETTTTHPSTLSTPLAWVLVSADGRYAVATSDSYGEYVWWPAVTSPGTEGLYITDLCGPVPESVFTTQPLRVASVEHAVPFSLTERNLPFTLAPKFQWLGHPYKHQKRDHKDLTTCWAEGVSEMRRRILGDVPARSVDEVDTSTHRLFRSPSLDETVPGLDPFLRFPEQVLARWRPSSNSEYWPALVVAYIPPADPGKSGRYLVQYFDDDEKEIPRDWFFTLTEPGFRTCRLGKFQTLHVLVNQDTRAAWEDTHVASLPTPDAYNSLSIREQFRFVVPIVNAILLNQYEPSRQSFQEFSTGGKKRRQLIEKSSLRGDMEEFEVEEVLYWISEYCLRNNRTGATDDGQRPIGCAEYEAMSDATKLDFCSCVVLIQVVKQILLWRYALRESPEVLTMGEEVALSDTASSLLKQEDWVEQICNKRKVLD
ncbi:hypothetical protein CYLTODRAFT_459840 [Cylindrobasidium torrendii FP15055 ss-10]|uniref:Uncharacterized protein n=1 Tax=Cylindrobasidium torrendii FP15055 ss-10 TaxID=1314674 RepID=A0A0D7AW16_9AGAR|nr:hypothetical protein CYLTODRAFT_459840 [Cylindrobasidium torrendii FP15055 ss-10]